ncbi:hypothetical protein DPEC_G00115590 [Dallia pectoralis]|uniref:Uncharacterized protein n=1 Tax=Dallia pectoralis TaxID=75939 RepID=A0ACC2GU66_DALPE|nr:hypothetical protein DPEC_G00115590 [Dallia pectoralis]
MRSLCPEYRSTGLGWKPFGGERDCIPLGIDLRASSHPSPRSVGTFQRQNRFPPDSSLAPFYYLSLSLSIPAVPTRLAPRYHGNRDLCGVSNAGRQAGRRAGQSSTCSPSLHGAPGGPAGRDMCQS